jgi:hypothetical protein
MADRRYKLLRDGLTGPRSFDLGDLTANDVPRWNATTGLWDLVEITDAFLAGSIMPAGTVTNSTLRWNGSAWVENTELLSQTGNNRLVLTNVGAATNLFIEADLGFDSTVQFRENSVTVARTQYDASAGVFKLRSTGDVWIMPGDAATAKFSDAAGVDDILFLDNSATGKSIGIQDETNTWASVLAKTGIHARDSAGSGMGWITWYNKNLYMRVGEVGAVGGLDGSFIRLDGVNTAGVLDILAIFNVAGSVNLYHNDIDVFRTAAAASGGAEANNTATGAGWERVLTTSDIGASDHGALTGLGDDDHTIYALADGTRTFTGEVTAPSLRLTDTNDLSLSSTLHAFQIGASNTLNIAMDNNEIMARNNGLTSTLNIQTDGGQATFGGAISAGTNFIRGGDIYPGNQTVGHLEAVSGNYGSVQCEGADGSSGTWLGYSINGRGVFMNNNSTDHRLYNDTHNQNYAAFVETSYFRIHYNGTEALETNSIGNVTIDNLGAALHHGTALTSGRVTTSTSAPSGGTNGDVWFRY